MKTFQYIITDEIGIHARPAGMLVKEAKKYNSDIVLEVNGTSSDAKKLIALMALGVKNADTVTITATGVDEEAAAKSMEAFLKANL